MPASGSKPFIQGCHCQSAVDEKAPIVVASQVTQEPAVEAVPERLDSGSSLKRDARRPLQNTNRSNMLICKPFGRVILKFQRTTGVFDELSIPTSA
jgi:hypothetical protein